MEQQLAERVPLPRTNFAERMPRIVKFGERSPHNPTPLDAWRVQNEAGLTYVHASLNLAYNRLDQEKDAIPDWLYKLAGASLANAITRRCDENSRALLNIHTVDPRLNEIFEKAKVGDATSQELIILLVETDGFGSVELAKLSHPFDWKATEAMDTEINMGISELDPNLRWRDHSSNRRLRFFRSTLEGMVLQRSRDIAFLHKRILITKESSLIVRFDDDSGIPRNVKQAAQVWAKLSQRIADGGQLNGDEQSVFKKAGMALTVHIEDVLHRRPTERPLWLQPTVTSYRATDHQEIDHQKVSRDRLSRPTAFRHAFAAA